MKIQTEVFHNVSLVGQFQQEIRHLKGFDKKRHKLPTSWDSYSVDFIRKLAQEELDEHLESMFQKLRSEFRWKRKEISVSKPEIGFGSVSTPVFDYSLETVFDNDDLNSMTWRRSVDNIREPQALLSESFSKIFDQVFDRIEQRFESPIQLAGWIDHLEDLEDPKIRLDYDSQLTHCDLRLDGIDAIIQVAPEKLQVIHPQKDRAQRIVDSFLEIQKSISVDVTG